MTTANTDQLVWHYTDASGLLGMIQGKQLWATHFQFMNDLLEGSLLTGQLQNFIESNETLSDRDNSLLAHLYEEFDGVAKHPTTRVPDGNRFLLCGSTEGDELTLWRNYAKDSVSYAVGLDPNAPLGVIPPGNSRGPFSRGRVQEWTEVEYHSQTPDLPDKYANQLRSAVMQNDEGARIRDTSDVLHRILSIAKAAAFKDEREIRVVSVVDNEKLWRFRAGGLGVTPYIALGTSSAWGETSTGEEVLPIRAIRLSANATSADKLALNALLQSNGYDGEVEFVELRDDNGHVRSSAIYEPPPVKIFQANNSLRF